MTGVFPQQGTEQSSPWAAGGPPAGDTTAIPMVPPGTPPPGMPQQGMPPGGMPPGGMPPFGAPGVPGLGAPPPPPKKNRGLIIGLAIAGVVVLLFGVGLIFLLSGGPTYANGTCVKESNKVAEEVACGEKGAYKIVKRAPDRKQCPDPNAPYVDVQNGDKREVLCLQPQGK